MLKLLFLLVSLSTIIFANTYYAKIEPYEVRDIFSNAAGEVVYVDENMLGKRLSKKAFIRIDDTLNRDELKSVKEKIAYFEMTLENDEKILENLKESLRRKKENFHRIESLSIKSKVEKDREFYNVVSSENSYLATRKEVNSLQANLSDLKLRQEQLLKTIHDKSITANGFLLYGLKVKPAMVVNIGTPLARVADISRGIITIYLDKSDLHDYKDMIVYIDGKRTHYRLGRVIPVADTNNISRYRAQIVVDAPKYFSQLVKIELKKEQNAKK